MTGSIGRLFPAALCCLLLFRAPAAAADTVTSGAVRPFAETETESRAPSGGGQQIRTRGGFFYYQADRGNTFATVLFPDFTNGYPVRTEVVLRDARGKTVNRETFLNPGETISYSADLPDGVYTLTQTDYDSQGKKIGSWSETVYFMPYASNVVGPYPSNYGFTTASTRGYKTFNWYPFVNKETGKTLSKRYRIRITDDGVDQKKDFAASVLLDETTTDRSWSVKSGLLPAGSYTVKVWAYDGSGTQLDVWMLKLQVINPWRVYDYRLITDLNFVPGEAITRQHAVGGKDMTPYGAVRLTWDETPMTRLTLGGETLDADCGGAAFTVSLDGETLILRGGSAWRVSQKALRTLHESGVATLRLVDGTGAVRELPTDLAFSGRQYALLRAEGLVSKDFVLSAEADGWRVTAAGAQYDLLEDEGNALAPRAAAGGGA